MGRRENSGRKLDSIWAEFNRLSDNRVSCRHCSLTNSPLVARMRKHFELHIHVDQAKSVKPDLPEAWFAANVIHPKYIGKILREYEIQRSLEW